MLNKAEYIQRYNVLYIRTIDDKLINSNLNINKTKLTVYSILFTIAITIYTNKNLIYIRHTTLMYPFFAI